MPNFSSHHSVKKLESGNEASKSCLCSILGHYISFPPLQIHPETTVPELLEQLGQWSNPGQPSTDSTQPDAETDRVCRSQGKERYILVGLHTCGDLAPTMLRMFCQSRQIVGLVSVGCCYMKITCAPMLAVEPKPEVVDQTLVLEPDWKPTVLEPDWKPTVLEPDWKPTVLEPDWKPTVLEPDWKPTVLEPDRKPTVLEPDWKPTVLEPDWKPTVLEPDWKPTVLEPDWKPTVLEPDWKPTVLEPDWKPTVLEPDRKLTVLEPDWKPTVLEPDRKLTVLEPDRKPSVLEPDWKPTVLEPDWKLTVLEPDQKPSVLVSGSLSCNGSTFIEDENGQNSAEVPASCSPLPVGAASLCEGSPTTGIGTLGYPLSEYVRSLPGHTLSFEAREVACHSIEAYHERLRGRVASRSVEKLLQGF